MQREAIMAWESHGKIKPRDIKFDQKYLEAKSHFVY